VLVHGLLGTDNPMIKKSCPDAGYSFCNCKNIFFTDWKNIDQRIYDEAYSSKYNVRNEEFDRLHHGYAEHHLKFFTDCGNKFLEIGTANDLILDKAQEHGFETTALDINPFYQSKHPFIRVNIEDSMWWEANHKYDVIWTSHLVEHLREPIKFLERCFAKLNDGGYLFVAMPDPWYINWAKPHDWLHWVLREHHIMWDMESFIQELLKVGFDITHSYHNTKNWICYGDFQVIVRKPNGIAQ
jgi:2-polyprenyl-3-methyl-5-hydroxy-6-metoxy-1,4-benzoquinol methylase